jgi:excinuclease UvrABC nuclease subunit
MALRFSEVSSRVKDAPGLYEIHTTSGRPLKVGIGRRLKRRLKQHAASRQSCLRPLPSQAIEQVRHPTELRSKGSILAKHLFFDGGITTAYNLRTEAGRRAFLQNRCRIRVTYCASVEEALALERRLASRIAYRYCGRVTVR